MGSLSKSQARDRRSYRLRGARCLLSRLRVRGFRFLGRKKDNAAVNRHAVELNGVALTFGAFEGAAEAVPIGLLFVFALNDAIGDEVGLAHDVTPSCSGRVIVECQA